MTTQKLCTYASVRPNNNQTSNCLLFQKKMNIWLADQKEKKILEGPDVVFLPITHTYIMHMHENFFNNNIHTWYAVIFLMVNGDDVYYMIHLDFIPRSTVSTIRKNDTTRMIVIRCKLGEWFVQVCICTLTQPPGLLFPEHQQNIHIYIPKQ